MSIGTGICIILLAVTGILHTIWLWKIEKRL